MVFLGFYVLVLHGQPTNSLPSGQEYFSLEIFTVEKIVPIGCNSMSCSLQIHMRRTRYNVVHTEGFWFTLVYPFYALDICLYRFFF